MNRQGKWDESPFHCRCHSSGRMSGNAETGKLGDRRKYVCAIHFNLHGIQAIMAQERKIGLQIAGKQRVRITIAG